MIIPPVKVLKNNTLPNFLDGDTAGVIIKNTMTSAKGTPSDKKAALMTGFIPSSTSGNKLLRWI